MLRLEGFEIDFLSILGPKLGQGWGGPRAQFWPFFFGPGAVLGGRWPQGAPGPLSGPILIRFWPIFGRFFNGFLVFSPLLRGTVADMARRTAGYIYILYYIL